MKMANNFFQLNWPCSINSISLITLIFVLLTVSCKNDDEDLINDTDLCLVEINGNFEEIELEEKPVYLNGGDKGFTKAISDNISYPAEARENGIEGLCIINYEITEDGKVENIETLQDPGGGIGDSAVGTIELITEGISFSPGLLNGNPIRVKKELELKYSL